MSRTASQTPYEASIACENAFGGTRGHDTGPNINSGNRHLVRAWLVAEGIPSAYVQSLSLESLRGVWSDGTNGTLSAMRVMARKVKGGESESHGFILDNSESMTEALSASTHKPQPASKPDNTKAEEASQMLAKALAMISGLSQKPAELDEGRVRAIVAAEIKTAMDQIAGRLPLTIEVRRDGDLVGRVEGHHHPKFQTLLKAATCRDATGFVPNIWISGPAGSGKTKAVSNACKALDIGFEHNGALSMPHELVGFIDAAGNFHETAFTRAYDAACGYLFDEVDGSDNAALLALNAALANGHASLPKGTIDRHKDNRIFVAANTWGMGATAEYVGRAKLDAAFLDRFPVKIHFDYDEELERHICGNADWAIQVQAARAKARAVGLKVAITPRASIGGAALLAAGFDKKEVAELTYLAALTNDQRRQMGA